MSFTAANRAANQTAMAIQNSGRLKIEPLAQIRDQRMQWRLPVTVIVQTAHTQFELAWGHREHPAIPLGHPCTAQHETEALGPVLPKRWRHLQEPLHTIARDQTTGLR